MFLENVFICKPRHAPLYYSMLQVNQIRKRAGSGAELGVKALGSVFDDFKKFINKYVLLNVGEMLSNSRLVL